MAVIKFIYTVHEKEEDIKMVLNPCFVVVDRDGDFVDACSGRLPASTLNHVLERVNKSHPENAPFRIVKWNGFEFVEVISVS